MRPPAADPIAYLKHEAGPDSFCHHVLLQFAQQGILKLLKDAHTQASAILSATGSVGVESLRSLLLARMEGLQHHLHDDDAEVGVETISKSLSSILQGRGRQELRVMHPQSANTSWRGASSLLPSTQVTGFR
jgi:hypothetical protein